MRYDYIQKGKELVPVGDYVGLRLDMRSETAPKRWFFGYLMEEFSDEVVVENGVNDLSAIFVHVPEERLVDVLRRLERGNRPIANQVAIVYDGREEAYVPENGAFIELDMFPFAERVIFSDLQEHFRNLTGVEGLVLLPSGNRWDKMYVRVPKNLMDWCKVFLDESRYVVRAETL